jgi:drug/metabolite transporter (DMT)-like permease
LARRIVWSARSCRPGHQLDDPKEVLLAFLDYCRSVITRKIEGLTDAELRESRLVITEGVFIGLAGSLAGAAIGLSAAATFAGQAPGPLYLAAAAAVVAGVLVTAAAAFLPARALRRLPAAHLLAAD